MDRDSWLVPDTCACCGAELDLCDCDDETFEVELGSLDCDLDLTDDDLDELLESRATDIDTDTDTTDEEPYELLEAA